MPRVRHAKGYASSFNPVAHSMLEHVALADHVEEHGEAGHLAEAGPIEGLEVEAAHFSPHVQVYVMIELYC